jgi:hypothetical protein
MTTLPENAGDALSLTLRAPRLQDAVDRHRKAIRQGLADSGAMKEIPALKWLAIADTGLQSYRDHLLVQKLLRFLHELRDIPDHEREAFSAQLDADPAERERIGEQLFLLLERHDDMEKPALLGLAWREFLRGNVPPDQYDRLARAIDRVHLPHIDHLGTLDMGTLSHGVEGAVLTDLLQAGLIYPASVTLQLADELENRPSDAYHRTDIAHVLLELYAEHREQPV